MKGWKKTLKEGKKNEEKVRGIRKTKKKKDKRKT